MKKLRGYKIVILILIGLLVLISCKTEGPPVKESDEKKTGYDIRSGLNPSRLTIAMWDFSWLFMHYPGGAFEDFDLVTDELLERGFNTVRIDAFPLIIGKLGSTEQTITIPGDPLRNWGPSDKDRKHAIVPELLEFMKITREKGISVILSSWANGALEFPDITKDFTDRKEFWKALEYHQNMNYGVPLSGISAIHIGITGRMWSGTER